MNKITALLIDDDSEFQEATKEALALANIDTIVAGSRQEGLDELDKRRDPGEEIDVVLLDIMLPDGHGAEVLKEICGRSNVPVIMITVADHDPTRTALCLNDGAAGFEQKPLNYSVLAARIRSVMRLFGKGGQRVRHFRFAGWKLDTVRRKVTDPKGNGITLGTNEYDILCEFLLNPGVLIPHRQLAGPLHNEALLTKKISKLKRALGDDVDDPKFIMNVFGKGYQFVESVTTE